MNKDPRRQNRTAGTTRTLPEIPTQCCRGHLATLERFYGQVLGWKLDADNPAPTPAEAAAIAVALAAASDRPRPFGDAGRTAMRKIVSAMAAGSRRGAEDLAGRIHLFNPRDGEGSS